MQCCLVDGTFRYPFERQPNRKEICFRGKLDLNEVDSITASTFGENFLAAQKRGQPYYVVALVELADLVLKDAQTVRYQWHDAIAWRKYEMDQRKSGKVEIQCPLKRLTVVKTHFFALECFDYKGQLGCVKTKHPKVVKPFFPELYHDERNEHLALDALNFSADAIQNKTKEKTQLILMELQRSIDNSVDCIEQLRKTSNNPNFTATPLLESASEQVKQVFQKTVESLKIEKLKWENYSKLIDSDQMDLDDSTQESDELRTSTGDSHSIVTTFPYVQRSPRKANKTPYTRPKKVKCNLNV